MAAREGYCQLKTVLNWQLRCRRRVQLVVDFPVCVKVPGKLEAVGKQTIDAQLYRRIVREDEKKLKQSFNR